MRRLVLFLIIPMMVACTGRKISADLILYGDKIYTLDEKTPVVEAVVVIADTIAYAGNREGARRFEGKNAKVIELGNRMMAPGFIESHGHLMAMGYGELELDLSRIQSYEELLEKVKSAALAAEPGEWIIGRGWHQDKWSKKPILVKGFQTHALLSAVSPDNPVFLEHASGHAVFVNAKAMQLAGIGTLAKEKLTGDEVAGGEIVRDALGNPTGILIDHAEDLILRHLPAASAESDAKALSLAIAACLRNGITSFHDAGATRSTIDLYKKFKSEGKLVNRLYVMLEASDGPYLKAWFAKGPEIDSSHLLTIRSVKIRCDGALGTRSAWLLKPYSDRPDFYGMATLPMDSVLKISRDALRYGFQVCAHAIGDRANREILDRYEVAFRESPANARDHRFRIEHAQHLHPDDIPRFGQLGVIASMQAIHLSSDRPWAIERLGKQRIEEGAYVWQSLLRSGARVINGTDVPVEPINPVACFYAAVTRKTLKGEPEEGYEPGQKMTRAQALRSYTLDAAYGAFEDPIKGSIEAGKLADFTIFSQDIMTAAETDLLKTEVLMTIVGGKIAFEKK